MTCWKQCHKFCQETKPNHKLCWVEELMNKQQTSYWRTGDVRSRWRSQSSGCSAWRASLVKRRGRGRAGWKGRPRREYWEHLACWELASGWACFSVACLCNSIDNSYQLMQCTKNTSTSGSLLCLSSIKNILKEHLLCYFHLFLGMIITYV